MPVPTIYLTTTNGRFGSHLVWGMISTDFILFLLFFFSVIFYVFCVSWVLYYFLFCFLYIFKCFLSQTSQGTRGRPIPPPFLEREFSVLTRLKSYSRESGRLPRSELSFRPGRRLGPYYGRYYEHPLGAECSLTVLPVMMLKKNNIQERHKNIYVSM